jgi:hypothetical protein
VDDGHWQTVRFVPNFVDKGLRSAMVQRCWIFTLIEVEGNIATQNSFLDMDRIPASALEALAYLPRAALLGVLAPWPDRWAYVLNNQFSMFYVVAPVEAAVLYGGLIGLTFWLLRSRAWGALVPVCISVSVMAIYGAATPYLGALYRYRYPWWMLLICMGMAALLSMGGAKNWFSMKIS